MVDKIWKYHWFLGITGSVVNKHFEIMIDYSIGHASTTSEDQISFETQIEGVWTRSARDGQKWEYIPYFYMYIKSSRELC